MKFEEAIIELRKGKKIRRKMWSEGIVYGKCGFINCYNCELGIHDLLSDDWEVLEEPGKSFHEVFEAFKEGKKIKRKDWRLCDYLSIDTNICSVSKHDLLSTDWEILE